MDMKGTPHSALSLGSVCSLLVRLLGKCALQPSSVRAIQSTGEYSVHKNGSTSAVGSDRSASTSAGLHFTGESDSAQLPLSSAISSRQ